ncbi:hypothetical protein IWX47DRAFT_843014 [Phyllosticta citricarpa]
MPQQRQQPQHACPLPAEANRLQDAVSSAVHAARTASSRSTPTPAAAATRPRPSNASGSTFAQRHAEFRSFAPLNQQQQRRQRPAANARGPASGTGSLKKFLAEFKETYRAAPENDTAVLSREVREWYRGHREEKKEKVAAQVRAHVQLQQRQEEEAQRLLHVQQEQYRQQQELLLHQRQLVREKEASVAPRIEVTDASEDDWRSGRTAASPPEQFYDFVVRERATESSRSSRSDAGDTVPTNASHSRGTPEELHPRTQGYRQDDYCNQPSEHGAALYNRKDHRDRAAPRAGRLLYVSERLCYGPNEQPPPPSRPAQPDDLEVLKSKIQDFKTDIMEGRQRHKAAKAARRLAASENKEREAREKWRREMKGRIGGPVLLVAGEERIGILGGGARQSLDELSPVRSPVSPLRRHSSPACSPVVARPFAPPGRVLVVPQVIPSPVESNRKSSPPAFYANNATRFTQWDDFVNPRPTPPAPPALPPAPPGTASSSITTTTTKTKPKHPAPHLAASTLTPPASSKSTFSSTSTTASKATFASIAFKPTLPKLFTRGLHHHHASSGSSSVSSGASSFGCRGISAGAEVQGMAAMMMRAARASAVQQQRQGSADEKDGGSAFRSPLAPIRRVSPLAVEFGGEQNGRSDGSDAETDEELERAESRYSVIAAVPSPLNIRKTATTPLVVKRRGLRDVEEEEEEEEEERYDSMLSSSSSFPSPLSPSSNHGGRGGTSRRAESTFSRPSWWTWESSASPVSPIISPPSAKKPPQLVVDAPPPQPLPSRQQQTYDYGSDSDSESLYKAPTPRKNTPPDNGSNQKEESSSYVPPRANWTTTNALKPSSSASTFSSYPASNNSGSSGGSGETAAAAAQGVKEKTRFWDEVRRGLRPSNASFPRR